MRLFSAGCLLALSIFGAAADLRAYWIDDKWFVNAEADGGGLNNSATGQGLAAVGHNWTPTTLGYRVYTYDQPSSGPNRNYRLLQWTYGPFAALKYGF